MLDLQGFGCRMPGRGTVLDDVSLSAPPRQITAIVGCAGSGGATLVRALSGTVPPGTRLRGTATLAGRRIDGATPDELAGTVLWVSDDALPGGTVADCLRVLHGDVAVAKDVGLQDELTRRMSALPIDLRLRLHCASLLAATGDKPPALVLVDRVLGAADGATRDRFCALLRSLARSGATVLWAEHDLDAVWEHADHLVELVDGHLTASGAVPEWQPRSVPEPTLMTQARALSMPLRDCRTPRNTAETLETSGVTLPLFPSRTRDGSPTGAGTVVDAETLGLTGAAIELRQGECVGLLDVAGRPEALARRWIAKVPGGDVVPSQLPPTLRIGAAARIWERRHQLPAGSVLRQVPTLHPRTLLLDLSPGERASFRTALAEGPESPLWLPHPQAWLDPRQRHTLAEDLRRRPSGTRLVTSRDVEFLVRACHRLVVVEDGRVIGDGSPGAVADLLSQTPLVSRAVGSTRYLRLTDVLSTTAAEVTA